MPEAASTRLGAILATLLCLGALASPPAGASVKARAADSFVDSIGVNLHTSYTDTPYATGFATVKQRLEELGIRHVRDGLEAGRPDQYQRLNALAAAGISSTLILGSPADGADGLDALLAAAKGLSGVAALEGPNEHSTSGDPEWKPNLIAYQQALYAKAKGDPALASLPVLAPSIVGGDHAELGDISAYLDHGNIHPYPGGDPPDKIGAQIKSGELNAGTKPILATETGYHTALGWHGEHPPVTEAVMATYMPRLFMEYFRWGIVRTFSYELLDEWPDPLLAERESNFGLLRHDLSPKPAFDVLRNTIAILADPGAPFTPGELDYTLAEAGILFPGPESTGLHKVLLQKRDGSFFLALWRTSSVWDPAAQQPLPAPVSPVEVRVSPGLRSAALYLPNSSAEPVWLERQPIQPLVVDVGPEVTILRLVPGVPTKPEQPLQLLAAAEPAPAPGVGPVPTSPSCVVPKLHGRKLGAVRAMLRSSGCRLGAVAGRTSRSSRVRWQSPPPRRVLAPGARVHVGLRHGG